jgi:hypothetical protein
MADVEAMLARREAIAAEMSDLIGRLAPLVAEEQELTSDLRREMVRFGITAELFATQPNFAETICAELTAAGLRLHRADPRVRLSSVVAEQHRRTRAKLATVKAA